MLRWGRNVPCELLALRKSVDLPHQGLRCPSQCPTPFSLSGASCSLQEEAPCWVSTVHPLSSLWKQLSVTSSQRKGILSRKTAKDGVTQLFASPSLASVFVLSCFPSPTPRRENSQSGSFTKSFFGNLVKMAGGDSRLRTSLANGDEMTKPPGPQLHVRTKSIQ